MGLLHLDDALAEQGNLDEDRSDQEREADSTLAVPLQEGHQEPEADPDHHVDILIH